MASKTAMVTFLISIICGLIDSQLEVIPERAGMYSFNEKFIKNAKFYINRYNRKSVYYANTEGEVLNEWNNNVTVELIFYEKLGNDYKRSFIEIKRRFCDLVNQDSLFGPTIQAAGIKCPIARGHYRLKNLTLTKTVFPYKMPFEHCRVDSTAYQTETREVISSAYLYLTVKQRRKKGTLRDNSKNIPGTLVSRSPIAV